VGDRDGLDEVIRLVEERRRDRRLRAGRPAPFTIAVAGCVAVGKSTLAAAIAARLAGPPDRARVEVVSGDGFLLPNVDLERRGLMARKGFPETYDLAALCRVLAALGAGDGDVAVPRYSHERYEVIDEVQVLDRPDVVVFEGLHLLHPAVAATAFDLSIYVDADEAAIEAWYVERFAALCSAAADEPASIYRNFSGMTPAEIVALARHVWATINAPNNRDNIAATRTRADVVVEKGADHAIGAVVVQAG